MKLKAGDMVTVNLVETIDLFAEQFEPGSQSHPVTHLTDRDTAIVVSLSNHDGRCVYVIGPYGAGWTFGALLKKIK